VFLCIYVILLVLMLPCKAEENAPFSMSSFGKLTVYSDVLGADIYVDAKFVGQDRAMISNIPVGKHYVRVVKDEKTIQSGIVEVKEGEETIIVAKPSEEELVSRTKRNTYVYLFGSLTSVDFISTMGAAKMSAAFRPMYGLGGEVHIAIPAADLIAEVGFIQHFPALGEISGQSFSMAISSSNLNIVKEVAKLSNVKIRAGVGINYSLYSSGAGTGTGVGIASRIGYQAVAEAYRQIDINQLWLFRLGYVIYNGQNTLVASDISNTGYSMQFGMAYQL